MCSTCGWLVYSVTLCCNDLLPAHVHTYVCMYVCTCVQCDTGSLSTLLHVQWVVKLTDTGASMCICVCMSAYVCACVLAYIRTYIQCTSVYIRMYVRICTYMHVCT